MMAYNFFKACSDPMDFGSDPENEFVWATLHAKQSVRAASATQVSNGCMRRHE